MIFGKTLLITFEGLDGCGKSTLAKAVMDKLKDLGQTQIDFIREPSSDFIDGLDVRKVLINNDLDPVSEILLQSTYRRENVVKFLEPKLADNVSIIQDRFALSTYAYNVYPFIETNPDISDLFAGTMSYVIGDKIPEPITFVIDVPTEVRMRRMNNQGRDLDRYESDSEYQAKVEAGYEIIKQSPAVVTIDGELELEKQVDFVIEVLKAYVEKQDKAVESIREELESNLDDSENVTEAPVEPSDDFETPSPDLSHINVEEATEALALRFIAELNDVAEANQVSLQDFVIYKERIIEGITNLLVGVEDERLELTDPSRIDGLRNVILPAVYYSAQSGILNWNSDNV